MARRLAVSSLLSLHTPSGRELFVSLCLWVAWPRWMTFSTPGWVLSLTWLAWALRIWLLWPWIKTLRSLHISVDADYLAARRKGWGGVSYWRQKQPEAAKTLLVLIPAHGTIQFPNVLLGLQNLEGRVLATLLLLFPSSSVSRFPPSSLSTLLQNIPPSSSCHQAPSCRFWQHPHSAYASSFLSSQTALSFLHDLWFSSPELF